MIEQEKDNESEWVQDEEDPFNLEEVMDTAKEMVNAALVGPFGSLVAIEEETDYTRGMSIGSLSNRAESAGLKEIKVKQESIEQDMAKAFTTLANVRKLWSNSLLSLIPSPPQFKQLLKVIPTILRIRPSLLRGRVCILIYLAQHLTAGTVGKAPILSVCVLKYDKVLKPDELFVKVALSSVKAISCRGKVLMELP
jgi:hypothetical protein